MASSLSSSPAAGPLSPGPAASEHSRPVVVVGAEGRVSATVITRVLGAVEIDLASFAGESWILLRAGTAARASAFVPGQRRSIPVKLGQLGSADEAMPRPPRRVDVEYPAKLLERVWLASAPGTRDHEQALAEVLWASSERAAGVVFVVGGAPPSAGQLALLEKVAAAQVDRLAFVLASASTGDGAAHPAAAVDALRTLLAAHHPALGSAPWFSIDELPPEDLAAAGVGDLEALRRRLVAWGEPAGGDLRGEGTRDSTTIPRQRRRPAPAVPADDDRWREVLGQEIDARRSAAVRDLADDLAGSLARCTQALALATSCAGLPYLLDGELHALSVRSTRRMERDVTETAQAVCDALLGAPVQAVLLERVLTAVRHVVEADERSGIHALLLTATSGVAAVTGWEALDCMAALGPAAGSPPVLPPVAVGISASCYARWRQRDEMGTDRCREWLRRSVGVVETEVRRELDRRFEDLRHGLNAVAADAVDHGFLLA